jgi:hypothetical protein
MTKHHDPWQDHEREQRRSRLALTYEERLRWLEQAKRFARAALEAAQQRRRVSKP